MKLTFGTICGTKITCEVSPEDRSEDVFRAVLPLICNLFPGDLPLMKPFRFLFNGKRLSKGGETLLEQGLADGDNIWISTMNIPPDDI